MDSLSKEKLTYFKNKKKLTNLKITELTGLPISTVDKLFSGNTKNPTLDTLRRIAKVLDCSIDDFMDYEKDPLSGYYADRRSAKIAQEIQNNTELKELFAVSQELSKKDLKMLAGIAKRMSE